MVAYRHLDEVAVARFRELVTAYTLIEQAIPLLNKAISCGRGYVPDRGASAVEAEAALCDFRTELHALMFETEREVQKKIDSK